MARISLLISAVCLLCLYFQQGHGKVSFDGLFSFNNKDKSDVIKMKGTRIENPKNMTLDQCKTACSSNKKCDSAIFSETSYEHCRPTTGNCDKVTIWPRKSHGECHLLTRGTEVITFEDDLKDTHYCLDYSFTCRQWLVENTDDTREANAVKRDDNNDGCYIFTFTCLADHTTDESATARCCDHTVSETTLTQPVTLTCRKPDA